jgi:hypothetical protein
VALAPEAQLPRSEGASLSRRELLEDDIAARAAHEQLRMKWNALIGDVAGC